jgi:hypothetical protein
MRNKLAKLALPVVLVMAIIFGTLAGGVAAYAHFAGTYYLSYGWNYLTGIVHNYGYYSLTQDATLYSDDVSNIYASSVRQYNGSSSYGAVYYATYMWGSGSTYPISGFAGHNVAGYDHTAPVNQWFSTTASYPLTFYQLIDYYNPGFQRNAEGWLAQP